MATTPERRLQRRRHDLLLVPFLDLVRTIPDCRVVRSGLPGGDELLQTDKMLQVLRTIFLSAIVSLEWMRLRPLHTRNWVAS